MTTNQIILFTALLPVVILLLYIYFKDKNSPEPVGQLFKAFLYGVGSVFVSLCISIPLGVLGAGLAESHPIVQSVYNAFFCAAIPEEMAKLIMLWLVLRKNKYFDENMDGIVYAVCVSLGFAAFENVLYLFGNAEAFVSVGVSRAMFAVPGHFCFGVLMGYYYSLIKLHNNNMLNTRISVLAVPIVVHGIYDSILFISDVTPVLSGILTTVFLVFCVKLWQYARKRIGDFQTGS